MVAYIFATEELQIGVWIENFSRTLMATIKKVKDE